MKKIIYLKNSKLKRIILGCIDFLNRRYYKYATLERVNIIKLIFNYLGHNQIYADYAEFGVWRGDTFCAVYHMANYFSNFFPKFRKIKFYSFDSFKGFPKLTDEDSGVQFQEGGRACCKEDFIKNLVKRNVNLSRVIITEGWFKDTLRTDSAIYKQTDDNSIAFAYIDCDLYESTKDVLEFLKNKMLPGGIIVFDNWFCFSGNPKKGEQKAYSEFLRKYPEVILVPFYKFGWHGNSFIFHLSGGDDSNPVKVR